jgi:hypothetical protein
VIHEYAVPRPEPSRRLSTVPVPFTLFATVHALAAAHARLPFVLRAWTYGNALAVLVAALVVR